MFLLSRYSDNYETFTIIKGKILKKAYPIILS